MAKPDLRELLRMSLVSTGTRQFCMAIIKELEALRELVEPEDTDATIRKLRTELLQEDDRFRHIRARLTERREYWEKKFAIFRLRRPNLSLVAVIEDRLGGYISYVI